MRRHRRRLRSLVLRICSTIRTNLLQTTVDNFASVDILSGLAFPLFHITARYKNKELPFLQRSQCLFVSSIASFLLAFDEFHSDLISSQSLTVYSQMHNSLLDSSQIANQLEALIGADQFLPLRLPLPVSQSEWTSMRILVREFETHFFHCGFDRHLQNMLANLSDRLAACNISSAYTILDHLNTT